MADASSTPALRFGRWVAAHAVIIGLVYLAGVVLFLVVADRLDNDFAQEARQNHKWLIVRTHLALMPAYALILAGHVLLSWPLAWRLAERRVRRGRPAPGRVRTLLAALGANLLLFVIGFGPVTLLSPRSLDILARVAAKAGWLDVYALKASRVQEIFTAVLICAAAALVFDAVRFALRATAPWRTAPRAAALVALGMLAGAPLGFALLPETSTVHRDVARPNILVIASDSLRWDHLGAHGYPRPTSPNIDKIIASSIDFDNAFTATASTLESWGSFLTGAYPANHGLRYMFVNKEQADRVARNAGTLPRVLNRAGYRTCAVGDWAANCFSLVDFGFEKTLVSDIQNLDVFLAEVAFRTHFLVPYYFGHGLGESLVPNFKQVTACLETDGLRDRLLGELDAASGEGKPFFGVLFLACTHLPYQPPHPFNKMFTDPGYAGPNRYAIDFDINQFIKYGFKEQLGAAERQHIIDLYDGGVAHFDSIVGDVVAHLERTGLDKNTILVVTSDHGDDLYDGGTTLGHGTNFFGGDQANKIPLVVRLPGGQAGGRRVSSISRGIDLMPTLLELVGIEEKPQGVDGTSLVPYIAGRETDLGLAAFAETCYLFYPKRVADADVEILAPADKTLYIDRGFKNLFVLKPEWHQPVIDTKDRMMRTGRWKLLYIRGLRGPVWKLYDMQADPRQTKNLSAERPDVVAALAPVLEEWMRSGKDQRWPATRDPH
jgi:arylsulfatase A-like enzyme